MYKLVIADDEEKVIRGLSTIINWTKLGFELCGCFSDGRSLMEYLQANETDVILCDICMPYFTGLQIAEYIHSNNLPTKIFLLTAYKDFEMAKQAVAYQVRDYLLKPVDIHEIQNKFTQLYAELEHLSEIRKLKQQTTDSTAKALNMIYHMLESQEDKTMPDYTQDFYLHGNCQMYLFLLTLETTLTPGDSAKLLLEYFYSDNDYSNICLIPRLENSYFLLAWCSLDDTSLYHYITERIELLNLSRGLNINVLSTKYLKTGSSDNDTILKYNDRNIFTVVDELIQQNLSEKITLSSICEKIYMNPAYFSRYFKQKKGVNFSDYLLEVRISRAKDMLEHTSMLIYEICEIVGIPNYKYFHKIFKAQTGVSPAEYRNSPVLSHPDA